MTSLYELQALTLAEALKECRTDPGALCFDPKRPEIARRRIRYIDATAAAALATFKLVEISQGGDGTRAPFEPVTVGALEMAHAIRALVAYRRAEHLAMDYAPYDALAAIDARLSAADNLARPPA